MDAQTWLESAGQTVRLLMGRPRSGVELYATAAGVWLVATSVLTISGKALDMSRSNRFTSGIVSVLGFTLILVGMVAAELYLPAWQDPGWRVWILIASGVLMGLVVVAPLTCWIQKGRYVGALIAWVFAALAAALVVVLVGAVSDGLEGGKKGAEKGKAHREQIERMLE